MVGGRGLDDAGRERALARFVADAAVASGTVDRVRYLWPADEDPREAGIDERVRAARAVRPGRLGPPPLRAPLGLGLPLRGVHAAGEARLGYYALPLLWRDAWSAGLNATPVAGKLAFAVGFVDARPRDAAFRRALDDELASLASVRTHGREARGPPRAGSMSVAWLFAICTAIWGSTWLAITWQLGQVSPTSRSSTGSRSQRALLGAWCAATGRRCGSRRPSMRGSPRGAR